MNSELPAWLTSTLSASPSPRAAAERLLFHGTIEPFEGRLVASQWEGLRWTSDDPCVAQSYCPETGGLTGWSLPLPYEASQHLLPNGPINTAIFIALGGDEAALDAVREPDGRIRSWRHLPNHPTNADAATFMAALGYRGPPGTFVWVKTRRTIGGEVILPSDHKDKGRLFILERPNDLKIKDHMTGRDGGLTGRQWTHTDAFQRAAKSGQWDGIEIEDVHQSKQLGHFGHRSIGLFDPTLARLRYHVVDIVHFDPWECWKKRDQSTTPEFDTLWASCQPTLSIAA